MNLIIEVIKKATDGNKKFYRFIPLVALVLGVVGEIVWYFFIPTNYTSG